MRGFLIAALLAVAGVAPAAAAEVTEAELMQAATQLGSQYDSNYNAKNAAGMAGLYAPDGVLVSPGPVVRGKADLEKYYETRFAAGATGHLTKVVEAHVLGDAGYGIGQFQVTVPVAGGGTREMHGNLAMVYSHAADGWHLQMIAASVPPPAAK